MGEQQSVRNERALLCMLGSKRMEPAVLMCLLYSCCKMWNKRGAKVSYPVCQELGQLPTGPLRLAYSEGSGQPLLSRCNAHDGPEPSCGADYESVDFKRLWSCFLNFTSSLFIPATFRRAKREL